MHAVADGIELMARLPTPVPPGGGEIGLAVPADRIHLFVESGARLA